MRSRVYPASGTEGHQRRWRRIVNAGSMDRRSFLASGLGGIACAALPRGLSAQSVCGSAWEGEAGEGIRAVIREPTLFAGVRAPIRSRADLVPRIEAVKAACGDRVTGPLTHIFRFDTPVEGYDSEIGFPVGEPVEVGDVNTHTLRRMHFFANIHEGSLETLPQARAPLYAYRDRAGLSAELELVEVFHRYDPEHPDSQRVENMISFLPWPETYWSQLVRVLGEEKAGVIWAGGERITPHTLVDERCAWVAASIERLKAHSTPEEQFDVLSRVALLRPPEDIERLTRIYHEAGESLDAVFAAQERTFLEGGRTRGRFEAPWFDGKTLHLSKVPMNETGYLAAATPEEVRKAFCFCSLVREAKEPRVDPIFCYRAAGWDRQLFEPILGVGFKHCEITHSILKGDRFCAWSYHLE
jgi:hypothetical protein